MTYQNLTPGLLTSEAERLGKVTVGTELGWAVPLAAMACRLRGTASWPRRSTTATCAARSRRSAIRGWHAAFGSIVDASASSAPFAGHYESLIDCGEDVRRGTVIGLLHDFERLDLDPVALESGVNGVLIAQAWAAPVVQGQHVVVVGRVIG